MFLSSVESKSFEGVRSCFLVGEVVIGSKRKHAIWVEVQPGVTSEVTGLLAQTNRLLLTTRFAGDDIWAFETFPLFVHIAVPVDSRHWQAPSLDPDDLRTLAWGELYATEDDALHHRLDSATTSSLAPRSKGRF